MSLNAGVPIESLECKTHQVSVASDRGTPERAEVQLSSLDSIPNKDFVLRYRVAGRDVKSAMLTQVTDKGLAALAACRELRWLDLTALPVTDAGLANLKGATKLDQLFLEGTKISSESLPLISQFSALEELDLSNVQISDASLTVLGKLRKLKTLHLTGSPITPAGVQRLKSLLPKTDIKQ